MIIHKGGKRGFLVCDNPDCSNESKTYPVNSVAKELDICEAANKDAGWAYDLGFFSMLCGHRVLCPECVERGRNKKVEEE